MLSKQQKETVVEDFKQAFEKEPSVFVADYTGIAVHDLNGLRRDIKDAGAKFSVIKKTLFSRALKQAQLPQEPASFEGQIAILYGFQDAVRAAKTFNEFSKGHETFKVRGGIFEGELIDASRVLTIASLPSQEVLRSQLVGILSVPVRNFLFQISSPARGLVQVLHQRSVS